MKKFVSKLIVVIALLTLYKVSISQTVEMSGHAFLETQEFHDNIKVKFERVAPSYQADSILTDSSGYYRIELDAGIYLIKYSKSGYIDQQISDTPIYHDTILPNITLEPIGIAGPLTGYLTVGTYKVGGDIYVPANETLFIMPGTVLKFEKDIMFQVFGELRALGTSQDSIVFTHNNDTIQWKGIDFKENSSDNSSLNYCIVEYSCDRGISIFKCSPTISNSIIQNNTHESSVGGQGENLGGGAGISLKYSNTLIKNVIVRENSGETLGCGIYCNDGNPKISNSLIINNVNPNASSSSYIRPGGGVCCSYNTHLTIENTVICFNSNSYGGGIYASGYTGVYTPEITVVNSILYKNSAPGEYGVGGAIAIFNGAILSLTNSLIWDNTGGNFHCDDPWLGVNVTLNGNLDSCDAYGNLMMDPLFVASNSSDFYLNPNSPCIDAGDNNYVTSEIDFLHNYRIWDGNNDNDTIVDIGAFEFGSQFNPVGIMTNESKKSENCLVFPNPSTGFINIEVDNISRIEIYDNSGRLVVLAKQSQVDISTLKSGIYFLKIVDMKQNLYSKKILKY